MEIFPYTIFPYNCPWIYVWNLFPLSFSNFCSTIPLTIPRGHLQAKRGPILQRPWCARLPAEEKKRDRGVENTGKMLGSWERSWENLQYLMENVDSWVISPEHEEKISRIPGKLTALCNGDLAIYNNSESSFFCLGTPFLSGTISPSFWIVVQWLLLY